MSTQKKQQQLGIVQVKQQSQKNQCLQEQKSENDFYELNPTTVKKPSLYVYSDYDGPQTIKQIYRMTSKCLISLGEPKKILKRNNLFIDMFSIINNPSDSEKFKLDKQYIYNGTIYKYYGSTTSSPVFGSPDGSGLNAFVLPSSQIDNMKEYKHSFCVVL